MKYPAKFASLATAASLALSGWVWVGATTEARAWSLSGLFSRPAYNTPRTVIGHTMYAYDPATARWIGAYTDSRRTSNLAGSPGLTVYANGTYRHSGGSLQCCR
jgi:hypothetical protein